MGHTLTTLLIFAKDESRAYRYGKDVYTQLCKKESLWHFHLMGTNYDDSDKTYTDYPEAILYNTPEGKRLINSQLSIQKKEFVKHVEQLKTLLKKGHINTMWSKGGQKVGVFCNKCFHNHDEYYDIFSLCNSISQKDHFVDEIYVHPYWGKITNLCEWKSFIEEYNLAKENKETDFNKDIIKSLKQGKDLWIIPAYTKT